MQDLKGTKTEANLNAAFDAESRARNRYTLFASKAREDKFIQIADIFEETAENERAHAELWYKILNSGIGQTLDNLCSAKDGEHYEHASMYPEFAQAAREEGFNEIAELFLKVGAIEEEHEKRFKALADNIENGRVFYKDDDVWWQCENCGHTVRLKDAPDHCPVCGQPQGYFEIKKENY